MDSDELRWTEPSDEPDVGTLVGEDIEPDHHGDDEDDLSPGSHLGRYVILSRQGVGGMGVVYAAYDPQLDRRVALKLMHRRSEGDDKAARRLLAEAKASAQFSHPNVITIHDVGTWEGRVFLAMEFVEGTTLSTWMREPGRDWQQILDVFTRAGRGLEAAHEAGLVHRDFKPDNVLVGVDGRVRVVDFGLARRFDGSAEPLERRDREAGTPAYMSPEQHMGTALDHRSDQFSFCVALYEALYGELPFSARTRFELALAVTDGRIGPAPRGAGVPNWVRYALLRGLDPEPAGRWEDMGELLDALARDPYHGVRQVLLGVAASILVVGSGVMIMQLGGDPQTDEDEVEDRCGYGEDQLALAWNDTAAELLRANLDAELVDRIAAWTRDWATMHRSACEATLVHRVQSEVTLDRRMLCLDQRLAEFDGVVRLLVAGRPELLSRAREAVDSLPELEPCTDARVLTLVREPPLTGETRERVEALDRSLARARTLEFAGDYREALVVLDACVDEARTLGFASRLAQAELSRGELSLEFGAVVEARDAIDAAVEAAELAGDDGLRAEALIVGVEVSLAQRDLPAARRGASLALAVLERIGADEVERVELIGAQARLEVEEGHLDQAELLLRGAIERLTAHNPTALELAELRLDLALVLRERGELAAGERELDQAHRAWAGRFGEQHPILARVEVERAELEQRLGHDEPARAAYLRALGLRERAFGDESLEVGMTLLGLARLEQTQGRPAAALLHLQRATAIFAALGPSGVEALADALAAESLARRELGERERERSR